MATQESELKICSVLPPYGILPAQFPPGTAPPDDWLHTAAEFDTWRTGQLEMLTRLLWPRFNADTGTWTGTAVKFMNDLTRADLQLVIKAREKGPNNLLSSLPDTPLRHLDCLPHKSLFEEEDGAPKFGESHHNYDRDLEKDQFLGGFVRLFSRAQSRKSPNHITFWFKNELQRPRPYQTALFMGVPNFTHEAAKTALHPSIISGHTLVGLMGVAGIFERILLDGRPFLPVSAQCLEQYAVDIGDRRVMAGVHYPSDNLASWLIALGLCNHVCRHEGVKTHLASAIRRSAIYKLIADVVDKDEGRPYRPAWEELKERSA